MSTRFYVVLFWLYQSFIQSILGEECHPDNEFCETYLTIYLKTGKHNALPASVFQSDFVKFSSAFHDMSNEVCEYDMSYPSFYYIRIDSDSSSAEASYQYQFGIHLFCNTNIPQIISCCNEFYDHYLNKKSYGILVETWVKHLNKGTVWQGIDIEGRPVDYFWNYKLTNSTFIAPTVSPTLSPLQDTIDCQYTADYLSIICHLSPPYTTHYHDLSIHARSSSLCTQLLDERSETLELLAFECDECNAAQCELNNVTYDEQTHEMEVHSIEIWLTMDCTISVDDLITFCITLDDDLCQYVSAATVQASSHENKIVLSDASIALLSPYYVSSQCMVYTVYDDIQSDIGVTDLQSIKWKTDDPNTHVTPCVDSDCCTFAVGNTSGSATEQITTLSVRTVDGSQHNISTKIQYQDNLAFIPLIFHAPHFVSFKPMYFSVDVLISCDDDLIHLDIKDWIASVETDGSIFSTKWNIGSVTDANRHLFMKPSTLVNAGDELIGSVSLSAQNMDILSSADVLTSITNKFIVTRTYGDIKAVISNGMYQYYPYELNGDEVPIFLSANEYSFDQDTGSVSAQWQYTWTCQILQNKESCPVSIPHDYDEPILQFTSSLLEQDRVYLFTLQIVDTIDQRSDQAFTMIRVSPSLVQMIVSVNIAWDTSAYYLPTYHEPVTVIASIDDYTTTNHAIQWMYVFCFEPSLENGVTCASLESTNTSMEYAIDPFDTLPNHKYIVHVNITSMDSESIQHGMVSTILQTSQLSHIYDFSISSDYHRHQSLSSDMYKSLYRDSDTLLEHVDIHLLSMKTHCFHPPCTYSYFYQIPTPNQDANADIPFYFALANGLSVSPLSGVILPWNYDRLNLLGCVEDMYGSITCQLTPHSLSLPDEPISTEICEYYTDITNHLLLLSKMDDTLRLAQFMTVIVFEIVDTETKDDTCIEPLVDLILQYMHEYMIVDPYLMYYPFHILQVLYLLSEHNVIGSNGYIHFIQIYDVMLEEYATDDTIYYLPYSDYDYIQWDVHSVMQSISYRHSVVALLNTVDIECAGSPHSIIHEDIYHIIYAISNVVTALLSQHPSQLIQHISSMIYLYSRRFEFDLDAQKYRAFALNEHYHNSIRNDTTHLESMSVSHSDIEAGTNLELQLLAFNPIYITQGCFHDHDYVATSSDEDEYNITSKTHLVYVSMKDIDNTDDTSNEFITLIFSWQLSNETIDKLNASNAFHMYCQQLDTEQHIWSDEHCQSSNDIEYILSKRYFACECEGLRSGQTYGLVMDIYGHDASLSVQEPTESIAQEIVALNSNEWIAFLCLFLLLLVVGYICPLCFVDKFAPTTNGQFQLFWVFYVYASVVLASFFMQIYLCLVGLMNDNTVYLWQVDVLFGLQCATLGVFNVFLLIIVNDPKCNRFKLLTPFFISVSNAIITTFIIAFTSIHAILIHHAPYSQYGSMPWALWMVYCGFICLIVLFVVYLSYYWHKGKNFSGGKPYQYTEGKRESTAILILIGGILLYCLSIINGYVAYAISNHTTTNNGNIHNHMRCFESVHWISLCILAAVIFMVRRFEAHERKSQRTHITTDNLKDEMTHHVIPMTDDSENDFEDDLSSVDAHSGGIIPLADGTGHDGQEIMLSFDDPIHTKPPNDMILLTSPIDPMDNVKQSLMAQASNVFSSTSEFEADPFMPHRQAPSNRIEEDMDITNLALQPSPWPGVDHTQSHLGTDALGNTMSYEPEIEMDFLEIDLPGCAPNTNTTTNMASEGIGTQSDGPLYVVPLAVRTRARRRKRKRKHKHGDENGKVQYSPYSDHGDSTSNHCYGHASYDASKHDHVTAIGADEHAQNGGHYVAETDDPIDEFEFEMNLNGVITTAPYSCYTANTHRRSTVDSNMNGAHSDPEQERSRSRRGYPRVDASTSSIGIFDWNTPPPLNQIREISLGHLNVNTWIDEMGKSHSQSQRQSQRGGIVISRRQTTPIPHLYGTGAGASINMEHTHSSPLPRVHQQNNKFHSRHTTATSMTGTYTQPDYANILTIQNDDDHHNIMKTQNLMQVPLPKTTNHLDSIQKEVMNIFEQKTNANNHEKQDGDVDHSPYHNGYH